MLPRSCACTPQSIRMWLAPALLGTLSRKKVAEADAIHAHAQAAGRLDQCAALRRSIVSRCATLRRPLGGVPRARGPRSHLGLNLGPNLRPDLGHDQTPACSSAKLSR